MKKAYIPWNFVWEKDKKKRYLGTNSAQWYQILENGGKGSVLAHADTHTIMHSCMHGFPYHGDQKQVP